METSRKTYIDVHTHWCMFGKDSNAALAELESLEANGFEAIVMFPLPNMGAPPNKAVELIPGVFRESIGLDQRSAAHDDLRSWQAFQRRWLARPRTLQLLSFLDVRAWDGQTDLAPWWGNGHAGIKGILIEDVDLAKTAMPPLRLMNDLSKDEYLESQRAVFAAAEHYGVPLVYHADLSLHGDFIAECLQEHPNLRVDIPHCGFSRRAMGSLFDRFPSLMTDISSLGPYMASDPATYRKFIIEYADRVMLGSDSLASINLGQALEYVERVRSLSLPGEVEEAVLSGNALRFLEGVTAEPLW